MQAGFRSERPLGYQQLASGTLAVATGFAVVPDRTSMIVIEAEGQALRYRDDGGIPTSLIGMPLPVGRPLIYTGSRPGSLRFIEVLAGGIVNASFYGQV